MNENIETTIELISSALYKNESNNRTSFECDENKIYTNHDYYDKMSYLILNKALEKYPNDIGRIFKTVLSNVINNWMKESVINTSWRLNYIDAIEKEKGAIFVSLSVLPDEIPCIVYQPTLFNRSDYYKKGISNTVMLSKRNFDINFDDSFDKSITRLNYDDVIRLFEIEILHDNKVELHLIHTEEETNIIVTEIIKKMKKDDSERKSKENTIT